MPYLSIIIPVYNKAKYLSECLDSVLAQTYKDFEIIIIDDGSKDDSYSICQRYSEHYPCIKTIHQENSGASAARNHGIEIAEGKWCSFIDADDYVEGNYLESLANHITSDSCMVMSNMEYGQNIDIPDFKEAVCTGIDSIRAYFWDNGIACHLGPCVKLFNRQILNRNNIRFPEDVSNGEDGIFVLEYLSHVNELSVFESRNYIYREVQGTLSKIVPSEPKAQNNYLKMRESWLSFMNLSLKDSRAWINSPLPTFLNIYIRSLFADGRVSFNYCLTQVRRYKEELCAMYNDSYIKDSTTGHISAFLLRTHIYILYVLYSYFFVRIHLKIKIG